jgi:uncharacterized membrane protein
MAKMKQASSGASEAPLAALQRRYAAGVITTHEYEERKSHLSSDWEVG